MKLYTIIEWVNEIKKSNVYISINGLCEIWHVEWKCLDVTEGHLTIK